MSKHEMKIDNVNPSVDDLGLPDCRQMLSTGKGVYCG